MNTTEVELLVRGVIAQLGAPVTVLSVIGSPTGWNIAVREGPKRIIRFTVTGGRAVEMRVAIQERLEAQMTSPKAQPPPPGYGGPP